MSKDRQENAWTAPILSILGHPVIPSIHTHDNYTYTAKNVRRMSYPLCVKKLSG
jgi:hypothetical protein